MLREDGWASALVEGLTPWLGLVGVRRWLVHLLGLLLLRPHLVLNFRDEKLQYTGLDLLDDVLVGEELDTGVHLAEPLQHCPGEQHHLNYVHFALVTEVKQYQHQVDLVLDELTVVDQVLLVALAKVGQQHNHAEDLKNIDDLLSLCILDPEQFVELLALILGIKKEELLRHLEESLLLEQVGKGQMLIGDRFHGSVHTKRRSEVLLDELAEIEWRIQLVGILLHQLLAFSFKCVAHFQN